MRWFEKAIRFNGTSRELNEFMKRLSFEEDVIDFYYDFSIKAVRVTSCRA